MTSVLRNPWVRAGLALLATGALLWGLAQLSDALTPFAVALGVAYFLNPVVNVLERGFERGLARFPRLRRRLDGRTAAILSLCGLLVVALALAVWVVVPAVGNQLVVAARRLPEWLRTLRDKVEPLYQRLNLAYPEQTEDVRLRLEQAAREHLPQLAAPLTKGLQKAFTSVLSFVLTLLNLAVIPVFAVYLLYDMNRIREGVKDLVPHRFRPYVYSRVQEVDTLLSAFARGQVTVCLILGAFYGIGLSACGVPMGLLVGPVIGFFNLIPFMSYVLGLPLALVLSWLDAQSLPALLAVTAVFSVGQFVEGNFITPRIVGDSLGLHAVVIMLAVLIGGSLAGFVGMLLAVPVTAALSVFFRDARDSYLGSDFFLGGRVPPRTE